jgi:hypothetical protein
MNYCSRAPSATLSWDFGVTQKLQIWITWVKMRAYRKRKGRHQIVNDLARDNRFKQEDKQDGGLAIDMFLCY